MTEITLDPMTTLGQLLWLCSHTKKTCDEPLGKAAAGFQKAISTGDFQIYRAVDGKHVANDLCATKFPTIDPDVFPVDENGKHGECTFFRGEVRQTEPA